MTVLAGGRQRSLHDLTVLETLSDGPRELVDRNGLAQLDILQLQAARRQRPGEHRQDGIHLEGLQHIVERAGFECINRGGDRALSGHHDAGQFAVNLAAGTQQRNAVDVRHGEIGQQEIERLLSQCRNRLMPGCESLSEVTLVREGVAQGPHQGLLIVYDQQSCRGAHADSTNAAGGSSRAVSLASAARNSARRGGLLSTRSTCAGMSFSASSRLPQPVRRMTGVNAEAALTEAATLRPSTYGMPRSVMTIENGVPCASAAAKVSMPFCPPSATVTTCPSCSRISRRDLISIGSSSTSRIRNRCASGCRAAPAARCAVSDTAAAKSSRSVLPRPTALSMSRSAL